MSHDGIMKSTTNTEFESLLSSLESYFWTWETTKWRRTPEELRNAWQNLLISFLKYQGEIS